VYALVNPFVQLSLLRLKPQDLPYSPLLMGLMLAAHWVLGVVLFAFRLPPAQALAAALVGTVLLCAMTVSLLYLNRMPARAVQTVTAMAGADVVVGIAALPVTAWLHGSLTDGAASGIPGLLFLLLLGWNLAVAGHVLRHALNAPLPLGIVVALVFYVLSVTTLNSLFPAMS
jgi:hypothetical protein